MTAAAGTAMPVGADSDLDILDLAGIAVTLECDNDMGDAARGERVEQHGLLRLNSSAANWLRRADSARTRRAAGWRSA